MSNSVDDNDSHLLLRYFDGGRGVALVLLLLEPTEYTKKAIEKNYQRA